MSAPPSTADYPAVSYVEAGNLALISALVVVDSLHFIVGRALLPYLHPAVSGMYLMGIGCLVVGVYGLVRRDLKLGIFREHAAFFLTIGFLVGASTVLTFAAMNYIDPGTGSMLSKMSVIVGILLGVLWLGERLTKVQVAGAILSLIGVLVITFQPGEYLRLGSLMVIIGTVMYAIHAAVVKRYSGGIDLLNFFFLRLLATTAILVVFVSVTPQARATILPGRTAWLILIAGGIVDVAISRGLYYTALRRFPMSIHAIILTLSPAATILWAVLLFQEYPQPPQILGGIMVLGGVLIAMLNPRIRALTPSR